MANAPYFVGDAGALAPRRGMFGAGAPQPQGRNILSRLGDFVTAWSAARGNPLGQHVIQQRAQQQQSLLDQQRRDQEYERRQADEQAQWLEREQWQRANPMPQAPPEIIRILGAAGIDPQSEQGQQMLRQYANNRVNPIQGVPYADERGSGIMFIRPGQGGGPSPPNDPSYWTPIEDEGGPSQPATGNFPAGGEW